LREHLYWGVSPLTGNAVPLRVEHVSYRYRSRQEPALRDVSFDLRSGEILLVAGASGCGKTTLIRCVNGLIPRSYKGGDLSGKILLNGKDPAPLSLAQISQTVGTVLQDPDKQIVGSYVYNEVAFGLENLALPRPEMIRRVDEILDYLGIAHLAGHETFQLSGGEKQKVALAGVLVMRPSILLLDEPLAQLDPQSAQDALALTRKLADEGLAVIVIEHRVEDLLSINPERALFLVDGQVRFFGDTAGFKQVADYREVKLPASLIMEQVARERPTTEPLSTPPLASRRSSPSQVPEAKQRGHGGEEGGREGSAGRRPPTPPGPLLVEFKNVTFAYEPGQSVLHDISLEIYAGDVIALLGPNGAGKSTLIKHAIGLLKPNGGTVLVNGEDTRKKSTAQLAKTLGYVFQSPTQMLFASSVREELGFGPRNLGYEPKDVAAGVELATRMVNLVGLEEYSPFSLSYGQQKRVSIAAIIAMLSRILAMDEPTAGQDYKNYTGFMDSILALPNFAAIMFITHDLDLAVRHANRVWLMSAGRIVADGKPEEILGQRELLRQCRLVPTSLLEENLKLFPLTGHFMPAESLASFRSQVER
jgi:energy-coupling factor transporter ATP-binding protein EcfA2